MNTNIRYEYDRDVAALYIYLSDEPYRYGRDLDAERRIDYAADNIPIGVELTCVGSGVRVDDLPEASEISEILRRLELPVFA